MPCPDDRVVVTAITQDLSLLAQGISQLHPLEYSMKNYGRPLDSHRKVQQATQVLWLQITTLLSCSLLGWRAVLGFLGARVVGVLGAGIVASGGFIEMLG